MRRSAFVFVAVVLALPIAAQNVDIEALSGLQFNFGNPGARSLGMGGAFLGLADDASAAEANPAGLTILRKPEVSIEARNYTESQLFSTTGTFPDTVRTPFTHYSDRVVISFASAVLPIKKKFTLGAYFHQPLKNQGGGVVAPVIDPFTRQVVQLTPNFFLPVQSKEPFAWGNPIGEQECNRLREQQNDPFACLEFRVDPFVSTVNVRLRTWGVAGAWQIHPKFSIGGTVRHQRFIEAAQTSRYTQSLQLSSILIQATAEEKNGKVELVEQTDTTFTGGFKWSPHEKFSLGGVYKQGPQFVSPLFFAGASTGGEFIKAADTTFHIPDQMGLGVSVRPIPALTVNFDAVRVKYSNLTDDFVAANADVREIDAPFQASDVTELHLGAEYFFATKIPIALRAGYWRDPAHTIEWRGPINDVNFVAEALLFPKGETQNHYSIGAGVALSRFQIDLAYDTSDRFKVVGLSMVTRF